MVNWLLDWSSSSQTDYSALDLYIKERNMDKVEISLNYAIGSFQNLKKNLISLRVEMCHVGESIKVCAKCKVLTTFFPPKQLVNFYRTFLYMPWNWCKRKYNLG